MSDLTKRLQGLTERLGVDGYPTADLERVCERMPAMEKVIVSQNETIEQLTKERDEWESKALGRAAEIMMLRDDLEIATEERDELRASNNRLHINGTKDGLRIDDLTKERDELLKVISYVQPIINVLAFDQKPRDAGLEYRQLLDARRAIEALNND